ncbi:MAG: hypothetical protein OEU98_02760 [Actinomycetota bacterium]|nr:hypothetical protein [Actinomycetota bacterium]
MAARWHRPSAMLPVLLMLLALVGVSGCGVSTQDQAQSLPSGALPGITPTPSPTPTPTPISNEATVYFVSGRGLEGVREAVNERSVAGVMASLAAGPPADRASDLRTLLVDPLTGAPVLTVVDSTASGQVVLSRTEAFTLLPANDQVLLVGQVVSSLAEVGISSLVITDEAGQPIPLVLPDGRVLEGPATAADYAVLVIGAPGASGSASPES